MKSEIINTTRVNICLDRANAQAISSLKMLQSFSRTPEGKKADERGRYYLLAVWEFSGTQPAEEKLILSTEIAPVISKDNLHLVI